MYARSLHRTLSGGSSVALAALAGLVLLAGCGSVPHQRMPQGGALPATEAFAHADPNPVKSVSQEPVSTFSIDVDDASYAIVRSSLLAGALPPQEAIRVEEMINYFPYAYPPPGAHEAPFKPQVAVFGAPWDPDRWLVHIALQGRRPATDDRPPLNLVFLVDRSGSMRDANKLPLLKQSFRLLLAHLRAQDRVAIVAYAATAEVVLAPTAARNERAILWALQGLQARGSTAGEEGLQLAYRVAERMRDDDGAVTRVVLATDGDFNVGISDPHDLEAFVARKRDSGVYLSVLGYGRGNLDDATMQALAQSGNGHAAYIDTLSEAQKALVDQLAGAMFPIANDVKIQVEFNPAVVADYRLIGYETRVLRRRDFKNDRVDSGDIGAGRQVTALYEVTPAASSAMLNDPLRYAASHTSDALAPAPPESEVSTELGYVTLRYKEPGERASRVIAMPILAEPREPDEEARFAVAIAGFGELLRGSIHLGAWGWDDAIDLASAAKGSDPYGYRAEAVRLMRLAQSLSR